MTQRVVITGMGIISPLGNDVDTFWNNLLQGKCGIGPIDRFDPAAFKVKLAAQVPMPIFTANTPWRRPARPWLRAACRARSPRSA